MSARHSLITYGRLAVDVDLLSMAHNSGRCTVDRAAALSR